MQSQPSPEQIAEAIAAQRAVDLDEDLNILEYLRLPNVLRSGKRDRIRQRVEAQAKTLS